jgi:transcription initiation factor IIF auxiliary subunit
MYHLHDGFERLESKPLNISERGLRMTASWLVILRPRARSTLAPRASLFRLLYHLHDGFERLESKPLNKQRFVPTEEKSNNLNKLDKAHDKSYVC